MEIPSGVIKHGWLGKSSNYVGGIPASDGADDGRVAILDSSRCRISFDPSKCIWRQIVACA